MRASNLRLSNSPRTRARLRLATSVMTIALCTQVASAAEGKVTPMQVAAQRQEILDKMLTDAYDPGLISGLRRVCATGGEPASVTEDRAEGSYFTPDATDECVAALVRTAHDQRLTELYGKLLTELGGSPGGSDKLPRAIAAAVLDGNGKVAIGNGKVAVVRPALAFDAGFTVAYQDGKSAKDQSTDAKALKAIAEACLGQKQDAGTCFSVGYVYGVHAFNAPVAASR